MRILPSLFFILLIFKVNTGHAQLVTPSTVNSGGGFATAMEWNIGESVSIANFVTATYSLNTGVLQPSSSSVTAIDPTGALLLGNQITIGPNPTTNVLHIKAKLKELGNLSFKLTDAKSALVFSKEVAITSSSYENDIPMEQYASGLFFLSVYFKPVNGNAKTAIYKIIKL